MSILFASLFRSVRVLIASALLIAMPALGQAEPADETKSDTKAKDRATQVDIHLKRGVEFFAEGQYELALVEFRAGYALDPRSDFLFALAQAERLSGDCQTAIVWYRRFLKTNPHPTQAEAARVNQQRCQRALESGASGPPDEPTDAALEKAEASTSKDEGSLNTAPSESTEPASVPVALEVRAKASEPPAFYEDPLTISLMGGAAVAVVVGGYYFGQGSQSVDAANNANSYDAYSIHMDEARSARRVGWVSTGIGVALTGAAVWRYFDTRKPSREGMVVSQSERGTPLIGYAGSF